jgi:hypothetical protein
VWNWAATRTFPQTVIEVARSQGLVRKHPGVFTVDGPLKTVLLNTPVEGMKLSRDMGGGLGFVHDSEDRFQPLDLLWLAARLESVGWPVEVIDGNLMKFTVGELLYYLARTNVDVLVAEVNLPTFESDLAFLKTVKEASRLRVVAKTVLSTGGFAERLLIEAGVDIVLLGECDLTIERVLAGNGPLGRRSDRLHRGRKTRRPRPTPDSRTTPDPVRRVFVLASPPRRFHDHPNIARVPLFVRLLLPVSDDAG